VHGDKIQDNLKIEGASSLALYKIPYGKTLLPLELPDEWPVDVIAAPEARPAPDPERLVRQALAHPLGGVSLSGFGKVSSVAIAVNDTTRPVPHDVLLPPLLEALAQAGIPVENVTCLIATGTHPPLGEDQFGKVLPQAVLDHCKVVSHNADDQENLVYLGETRQGTPVWMDRRYMEADLRVVVGNIEPHQFMGFSGGVKSAAIGLAGKQTINTNHALMLDPASRLGAYDENPARQDVEEIGTLVGVHFALNAVLNQHKQITAVLAGEPRAVMREGIPLAVKTCTAPVAHPYDLVIVSPGGHPKDINLYQSQKGLAHASLIAAEGANLILAAACPEGTGSSSYESWIAGLSSLEEVIERFTSQPFRIGPHKAWQLARDMVRFHTLLVSDLSPEFVRSLLLAPAPGLQQALEMLHSYLPSHPRVAVMPYANATIPQINA
jgi:lactate racemase